MKEIRLQYIPTGIVFKLPVEEALKIYNESRGHDYKILDEGYVTEEPQTEETTVYNQIVEEEVKEAISEETEATKLEALKAEADALGIKYNQRIGLEKLQKKIDDFYKAQ